MAANPRLILIALLGFRWTVSPRDMQRSAQFEHTVLVTESGHELLTVPAEGPAADELFADVKLGLQPAP